MLRTHFLLISILIVSGLLPVLEAAGAYQRYALILSDPPVAEARKNATKAVVENRRQKIEAVQSALRSELARQNFTVTGSVHTVLNAVFVVATPDQVAQLQRMPGVAGVRPLRRFRKSLNAAVPLLNGPAAWTLVGGEGRAGRGIKIAVIDTGIDNTHPAFHDSQLAVPSGFPKCGTPSDCTDFTNNKVIVARSYVAQLAAGFGSNPAATSRPDDYSARDLDGHGTAVAMCAGGETNTGPSGTITGMAPKAFLGNYKVFGSPEINNFSTGDVIISAIEDALNDGMDIAELSLGAPAFSGPLDQGPACGLTGTTPCDPEAAAVENAVQMGMLVVVAAGNEGADGQNQDVATLNTIDSPGDAPSAIAAGGSTNSHTWESGVQVSGNGVPSTLHFIEGNFGDGPLPSGPLTAPLRDVGKISGDPLGCNAITTGSLDGAIALIERGTCTFENKVTNAQNAGAVGAIFWDPNSDNLDFPGGLSGTNIPAILIGVTGGTALKSFIDGHANYSVTMDPNLVAVSQTPNLIAFFSSRGPSITGAVKPDVTAVGTDLYMAAESFDPNGDLYSPNGYTVANGTSFSTPLVAGGAALVKQKNPGFTALQIKSAVVNTAAQSLTDENGSAAVVSGGAGLLDAAAAVSTNITAGPATISFGILNQGGSFPASQQLELENSGSSTANLTLSVVQRVPDSNAHITLSKTTLSLGAGQTTSVTVTLGGSMPVAGSYDGFVVITGGAKTLHIPYLYIVGDGVPFNITPILSNGFDCTVGQGVPDGGVAFTLIDQFGVSIPNASIQWSVTQGGGQIVQGSNNTDSATETYGLGFATVTCGPTPGTQEFTATAGGMQVVFDGFARLAPTISANGAVNAASFQVGQGVAPGSYISLFGTGLSDTTDVEKTPFLPLGIDNVSVSFDVPSAGLSLPGRMYYVSAGQVNLQVPWELQGQTSALIKVNVEDSQGPLYTLPLAQYSPAFFIAGTFLAARDASGNVITSSNPAVRGQTIQLYANGLGPVDTALPTGQPAPLFPHIQTTLLPKVTVGDLPAFVQFSGLAPLYSGLYQVNVTIPSGLSPGVQPVVLTINGVAAPTANLPVQ
ncbi:MAG TPA: S8 family serine peptidase [Bryobacteraceae bacterium]|nr:S8 family serine peptidase [Bryobacteraceae bacterium]